MEVEQAIRTRRTLKAFHPEPVPEERIRGFVELAQWAPNHHLTVPWRFRVIGPRALEALKRAAGPSAGAKFDRAPTLVVSSCVMSGDERTRREDLHATAVASYIVLLAAHDQGYGGYWRTPEVLSGPAGRSAAGLPEDEAFVGLLYLGRPAGDKRAPKRPPVGRVLAFLS